MIQKHKELLLIDLAARCPYGVILECCGLVGEELRTITKEGLINDDYDIEEVKPYLFPLSSMTEEQRKEFVTTFKYLPAEEIDVWTLDTYDWCNKNNFDYRGLIPMGLSKDATNLNIY